MESKGVTGQGLPVKGKYMNHNEVSSIISKIIAIKEDYDVFFWIGTDGIFHNTENPNPKDELVCCCGISYSTDTGDWIVTPWLYNMDLPAIFKFAENARTYAFFWLNWMTYLYGDETEEPDFEADWLAVKSNRSVVMMLFDMAAAKFKDELYEKEKK